MRKREVNEQFGKKMNEDIHGNKKLFWKEVRKVGKERNGNLLNIMNRNRRLVTEEWEVRRLWREYFENL